MQLKRQISSNFNLEAQQPQEELKYKVNQIQTLNIKTPIKDWTSHFLIENVLLPHEIGIQISFKNVNKMPTEQVEAWRVVPPFWYLHHQN